MRDIADPMLKQEFRSHLDSKEGDKYLGQFVEKWIDYYEIVYSANSLNDLARDMTEEEKAYLSSEQKTNLQEIKKLVTDL